MLGTVDDQTAIDGLSTLRGAPAARGDRNPLLARKGESAQGTIHRFGHDDAKRRHLVMRGIRRIAAPAEAVEEHIAIDFSLQPLFQAGQSCSGHRSSIPTAAFSSCGQLSLFEDVPQLRVNY